MADNVDITAGAGTTIHADEYTHTTLGAGKTQLVKLVDGTLDAEAAIAADVGAKANALRVAPANDITDGTYIGDIKFGEAEPNSAAILADTNAMVVDLAAIETLLGTIDTDTGAMVTDLAAIEVLLTSMDTDTAAMVVDLAAIETLLTGIDADTDAIKTAVELIDNAISGSEMQVDIVAGGITAYTEDVASANPIVGQAVMMERDDTIGTLTPIEGDWAAMRCSAEGALWVQDFNSDAILADTAAMVVDLAAIEALLTTIDADTSGITADTSAIDIKLAAIQTALEIIDDWDDSNFCNVNCNIGGVDFVGGAGAVAAGVQRVTLASDDPAVVDLAAIEVLLTGMDADTDAIKTAVELIDNAISGSEMQVDIVASNTAGDVAHDTADSGNPVKVGGKAYNLDGSAPGTAVAEADRTNFITDVYGRQFVETVHPNLWKATDNQSTAQTNTALKAAPGAGLSLYITDIVVSNGATAGNVKFVEDTAGTPVDIVEVLYFAINGGCALHFRTPLKITANTDFGYTSVTVTTHSITVSGFVAP